MKQCLNAIEYLQKQIKPLPTEPQLSDFYHPSENQKNGWLLLVAVGTVLETYALYKYLNKGQTMRNFGFGQVARQ